MKLYLLPLILCLSACSINSNIDEGFKVFVGRVDWVKLYPPEDIAGDGVSADGLQVVIASNSCGTAEVKYTTSSKKSALLWMYMGEWCATPFGASRSDQLIVASSKNEILEYYPVEKDAENGEYVIVEDSWHLNNTQLRDLISDLKKPIPYGEVENERVAWASRLVDQGLMKKDGNIYYFTKGIFISDVSRKFNF